MFDYRKALAGGLVAVLAGCAWVGQERSGADYTVHGYAHTAFKKKDTRVYIDRVITEDLYTDGIHDPDNDAIASLQQPAEAMGHFPADRRGGVNWVKALEDGLIHPRTWSTPAGWIAPTATRPSSCRRRAATRPSAWTPCSPADTAACATARWPSPCGPANAATASPMKGPPLGGGNRTTRKRPSASAGPSARRGAPAHAAARGCADAATGRCPAKSPGPGARPVRGWRGTPA